jgi:outer membrane immunogenic protein
MKKILVSMSTAMALISTSMIAQAADLPTKTYAPPPVVAQVYNWTGLYVGVNGGYGWGSQDPLAPFSNNFDRTSFSTSGGMIGGTIGAQIQQGYVVVGVEGDLDWANVKGSGISTPTILGIPQPLTLNITSNISAVGTARIRTGVALSNWLFYATGGAAFVKSSANGTSIAGAPCGTLGVIPNCAASAWRPGLAAGLGTEWGFAQNWTAKVEYLYIDVVGSGFSTDHINTIRAGVNYRF